MWGCTYKSWHLKDVYVLVSVDPFESDDLATTLAQPGVISAFIPSRIDQMTGDMAPVAFDVPGRYVRMQRLGGGFLTLAEVEVWSK